MKITVLTLFKDMYDKFLSTSIIKRTIEKGLVEVRVVDIRDYALDRSKHVDDTPYGGGAGMLMKVDVLHRAILANSNMDSHVVLTSPKARPYTQEDAKRLALIDDLVIVCGHYEGIDKRVENYVDEKISIGDYILTGGELPSMVIMDSVIRLIDEAISDDSLKEETFNDGLLEYPQYTRPYEYDGHKVPDVLVSGNHKEIARYNHKMALRETLLYRPELLDNREFTKEELELLNELKEGNND